MFFVAAALVFCRSRPHGIGVCRAQGATGFFLGENLEPRKKSGKTLMRTRDGQAKGPRRRIHARIQYYTRVPIPRGCRLAPYRTTIQDDQPSERTAVRRTRARARQNARAASTARTAEGPTAEFARAAMRLLCGADGNTVQTTAPPTVPASLVTASTQMTAPAAAARVSRTRGGDNVSSGDPASC